MISLPAQTYIRFCQNKAHCFSMLKDRVTDFNKIFDFRCIDFVIHGSDHFSQVFLVNTIKALVANKGSFKNDNKEHVPSILLCNSTNQVGEHITDAVKKFIIAFLNHIKEDQLPVSSI